MKHQVLSLLAGALIGLFLNQCSLPSRSAPRIPGPAGKVHAKDSLAIAHAYASMKWMPRSTHVRHGHDKDGIEIHTPDQTLPDYGYSHGYWCPDIMQTGMPYQWGGFATPRSFIRRMECGDAAGDIATPSKRIGGDALVSKEATGIDCSGFISRCWRLNRSYSTAQLPAISHSISWGQLLPGDILINDRHVLLFAGWKNPGSIILAYEAGPFPAWKVSAHAMATETLIRQNYEPRRYLHMIHQTP